jgi:hypothetical protein
MKAIIVRALGGVAALSVGRWSFYVIVTLALISGSCFSFYVDVSG